MTRKTLELTKAEWTLMKVIWSKEPCSAPAVQAEVKASTQWSYSTVRTMMDRMVVKGILAAEKRGKITLFRSAISPGKAQRSQLLSTLANAFNGALTPMVQCLLDAHALSPCELSEIEALIAAKKKPAKK